MEEKRTIKMVANEIESFLESRKVEITADVINSLKLEGDLEKHVLKVLPQGYEISHIFEEAVGNLRVRYATYAVEDMLRQEGLGHLFPSPEECKAMDRALD